MIVSPFVTTREKARAIGWAMAKVDLHSMGFGIEKGDRRRVLTYGRYPENQGGDDYVILEGDEREMPAGWFEIEIDWDTLEVHHVGGESSVAPAPSLPIGHALYDRF